jgi:hypothetical protein
MDFNKLSHYPPIEEVKMLFIINKVNVKVPDLITLVNIVYCSKFHLGMAIESSMHIYFIMLLTCKSICYWLVSATLLAVYESLYDVRSTCADVERVGGSIEFSQNYESKSCVPNMMMNEINHVQVQLCPVRCQTRFILLNALNQDRHQ